MSPDAVLASLRAFAMSAAARHDLVETLTRDVAGYEDDSPGLDRWRNQIDMHWDRYKADIEELVRLIAVPQFRKVISGFRAAERGGLK